MKVIIVYPILSCFHKGLLCNRSLLSYHVTDYGLCLTFDPGDDEKSKYQVVRSRLFFELCLSNNPVQMDSVFTTFLWLINDKLNHISHYVPCFVETLFPSCFFCDQFSFYENFRSDLLWKLRINLK